MRRKETYRKGQLTAIILLAILMPCFSNLVFVVASDEPVYGGTVIHAQGGDPATLNPVLNADQEYLLRPLFNGLLDYDTEGNFRPGLAESYDVSEDGLIYTFHLRKGVKFHDGVEFTSADAKYTWEKVIDENIASPYAPNVAALESIEATDEYTVVFQLSDPQPLLLHTIAVVGILPKHLWENEDFLMSDYNHNPVGTGPFKFVSWKRLDHITMEANEDYWKGRPYLDKVIIKVIPETSIAVMALQAGDVDIMSSTGSIGGFPYESIEALRADPNIEVELYPSSAVQQLYFRCDEPPFDDKRVRQAVSYAIDRQYIIDALLFGMCDTNNGPISKGLTWAYNWDISDEEYYQYDKEKAEQLLDDAGYPRGSDGVRIKTTFYGTTGFRAEMTSIMKEMLAEVGIQCNIEIYDWTTYYQLIRFTRGEHGIWTIYDRMVDPSQIITMFDANLIEPGGENMMFYDNARVTELHHAAIVEPDQTKRATMYHEIQEILAEEVPTYGLYGLVGVLVYNERVHGLWPVKGDKAGHYLTSLEEVWVESEEPIEPDEPVEPDEPIPLETLEEINDAIESLSDKVSQILSDVSALESDVSALESATGTGEDITKLRSSVNTLQMIAYLSIILSIVAIALPFVRKT